MSKPKSAAEVAKGMWAAPHRLRVADIEARDDAVREACWAAYVATCNTNGWSYDDMKKAILAAGKVNERWERRERLARAVFDAEDFSYTWEEESEAFRETRRRNIDAVLEALGKETR